MKAVEAQIFDKQQINSNLRMAENRAVTEVNELVMKKLEEEERTRQLRSLKIKTDFSEGNKVLIQRNKERKENDRMRNLSMEVEKINKVREEAKSIMLSEKEKRDRERRELNDAIQRHMQAKREKEDLELRRIKLRANKSAIMNSMNTGLNLTTAEH